jgi:Cytochrome c554 and c-prime
MRTRWIWRCRWDLAGCSGKVGERIRDGRWPRQTERAERMTMSRVVISRNWAIALALMVSVAGGVSYVVISRGPGAGAGRDRELESESGSRRGLRASRLEALSAVKDGRFTQALEFYRTIAASEWQADDCVRLGTTLLEKDRLVAGWAVLEAARRIEPAHLASARALDALQGKMALATGRERTALHEAASRSELLREVPNGPALAVLALCLARYSSNVEQEEDFLDRLKSHHRSRLRGVGSVDAALLLIARLLLETGRTTDAVDILDPLVANPVSERPVSRSGSVVKEAAWLLSRAALQSDQQDRADTMLAIAGDFGMTQGASPEPSPFTGSRRCGECHPRAYREQQGESRHAQTLRFGQDLKDIPLPEAPVPDPVIKSISHGFKRKGMDEIEIESRIENRTFRAIVEYAVGSGRHGITMIARDEQGIARELRVSYYGRDHGWGLTKGIDFAPPDAGDHIGLGLGPKALNLCLSCHTTWSRSVAPGQSSARSPERADRGIGCERCHGPGLNHAKATETGYAELAIALGSRTPSQVRLNSCVECHAADGSVPPSDPEFTRAQGTTFLFSRCYTTARDRFGCTTCHDPHRAVDTEIKHYELKCLDCHAGKKTALPVVSDRSTKGQDAQTGRECPVNAKENCVSCHMPKVEDPTRRSRFTDHHIRVHRDLAPAKPPEPGH